MPATAPQPVLAGLEAYVPLALRGGLASLGPEPRARLGAFLSVDIVGFGAFAERLGRDGVRGAERLSEHLNGFFGRLIDVVHAHGGDVWILAGDAAHVVWFSQDGTLPSAARSAARGALELQRVLADGASGFRMRASIGAGALELREVGGVDGRYFPLLSGEAIAQAVRVDRLAQPGDVLVSAEGWEVLRECAVGEEVAAGTIRLASVTPSADERAGDEIPIGQAWGLERYVPPAVTARLAAGQAAFLAELRTLSIAFVQLAPSGEALAEDLQAAIAAVQEEVQRREGTVYQCLQDDKGLCVVAAFGLPPLAHDDDARRAVEAAIAIRSRLATVGIGIATGQVFCGDCGGDVRRQYSLIGTTINLAARLMQATLGDGLLCDAGTSTAARGIDFADKGALILKGFAGLVRAYGPQGRTLPVPSSAQRTVGRRQEIATLGQRLDALRTRGEGGAILIRGEAGIGKSALLRSVARMAREQGVSLAEGAAEAVERQTPLFAWRDVVAAWLGGRGSPADVIGRLRVLFGDAPDLLDLAPLLSTILGLEIPDNDLTLQMIGQVRADNVQRLLTAIAARVVDGPMVVAIEDAHWMDSASWAFVRVLRQAVPNVLFVATLRPVEEAPTGFTALLSDTGAELLEMTPLGEGEIAELLRLRLGARQLPEAFLEVVVSRAAGNPLCAEELALELRDTGVVEVIGDECRVVGGAAQLAQARIPPTIAAAITGRIDRLAPDVQLTLKVASVIGPGFDAAELAGVHPLRPTPDGVAQQLIAAERADMLVPDPKGTPGGYAFRHALIQETTYGLLPFAQRRGLHRAVAEYLEGRSASDATQSFGRLAHHWEAAEVPAKAVDALGRAGRRAMDAYASREAISFLTRALTLDGEVRKTPAIDLQRSEWHGFVGQAHYSLMEHETAVRSLQASIESAGFVFPTGGPRAAIDLARYLWTRWWPQPPIDDPAWVTRCLTAHRAYSDLGTIYLWMGKKNAFAHEAITASLALSRVAPCGQLAYQNAGVALLLGLVGLRKVADRDFRKACEMAEASQDLLGIAGAHVLYGMFLVMAGRPAESLPIYARAVAAAEKLHAGLWRHRSLHMSAEGSYFAGDYAASCDLYRRGAQVAEAAERHVTGLAHAMAALATLRLGDADAALREACADDGIPVVRQNPVPLSLFASLGALMEIHLERNELDAAVEAAAEAEALLKPGQSCDDYFAGVHGHAGLAATHLAVLARSTGTTDAEAARGRAAAAVKRLSKFARLYPGAGPRAALLAGQLQQLSGAERRAQRSWRHASVLAERMQMPFEAGQAHLALGRSSTGGERHRMLTKAADIFGRHGMRGWVRQAEGLLSSS